MTSAAEQTATKREWRNDASCLQYPPEMFFPEPGDPGRWGKQAREVCAACPVRAECLDDAVRTREEHGIRAGLNERGIRQVIAQRGLTTRARREFVECGTPGAVRRHQRKGERPCERCRAAEALRRDKRKVV